MWNTHRELSGHPHSVARTIVGMAIVACMAPAAVLGVERVQNGTFSGGSTNWTQWAERGSPSFNFASANVPTGGSTPALQVSSSNPNGHNGGVFQELSLVSGETYTVTVLARDNTGSSQHWQEVVVGETAPVNGSDYGQNCTETGPNCDSGVGFGCTAAGKVLLKWFTGNCDNWNGNQTTACRRQCTSFVATSGTM
jgi:hypothetical protein